jgi:S-adenosylmethionine-diacylgycerolhomoserine-N-methlytransferase
MSFAADLRVLFHLAVAPVRGATHQDRLESFYARQAEHYDDFRARLLRGRQELYEQLPVPEGGVWIEMGGGTGSNLQCLGDRLRELREVHVVDLSPSLLRIADKRVKRQGWSNVVLHCDDATSFSRSGLAADVITFSYALTMIPNWFAAIDNACRLLRPGGVIGVVDFFVGRKHAAGEVTSHRWSTRTFWPMWFAADNVMLSPDHVPFLHSRFERCHFHAARARVPYLPLVRVPYYQFIGRSKAG